jgi:hypothetical protein
MLSCCRRTLARSLFLPVDVAPVPSRVRIFHEYSTKLVSAAVSIVWDLHPLGPGGGGQAARGGTTHLGLWAVRGARIFPRGDIRNASSRSYGFFAH